ncbi:PAS domain S-box protein [Spirochaeta cellobiosiphila]|uniref:PAS domain S-box protein n=1 Tax=Spirochaeta cellobiosiphila TaxID=504483 RepID=UPI00041F281F|nr:PAS domain S-box protein [Spirochaeta cellobiosiphila]
MELFDKASIILIKMDITGVITYCNSYGEEFFGYQRGELPGQKLIDTIIPTGYEKIIQDLIDQPDHFQINENENICKDGRHVWISWTNQGIYEQEELKEILSIGKDITNHKYTESQLLEGREFFYGLFDSLEDGVFVVRMDNDQVIQANQSLMDLTNVKGNKKSVSLSQLGLSNEYHHYKNNNQSNREYVIQLWNHSNKDRYATLHLSKINVRGHTYCLGMVRDITETKNYESRINFAQEIAQLGSFEYDYSDNKEFWSLQLYKILGYQPEEIKPSLENLKIHLLPEDRKRLEETIDSLDRSNPKASLRVKLKNQNRWCQIRIHLRYDAEHHFNALVGTLQDITKIKFYQDSIEWHLQLNTSLSNIMEEMLNPQATLEELNKITLEQIQSLTKSEVAIIGLLDEESNLQLTILQTIDHKNKIIKHLIESGAEDRLNTIIGYTIDEGKRFLTNNISSCSLDWGIEEARGICHGLSIPLTVNEKIIGIIAIGQKKNDYDHQYQVALNRFCKLYSLIKSRIEAQDNLIRSEDRYKELVENSSDWIWEVDREGKYTYVSKGCYNILGYTPEELTGQSIYMHMPHNEVTRIRRQLLDIVIQKKEMTSFENINKHKNNYLVTLETNGIPMFDSNNHLIGYRGISRDVTIRKEVEKTKDDMERLMRHDLRTPLNSLIGFPQILNKSTNLTEKQRKMVSSIEIAAKKMMDMINLYLDLSKIESGTFNRQKTKINLTEQLVYVINDLKDLADQKEIPLLTTINGLPLGEPTPIYLNGEASLVYASLSNILKNAIEASPEQKPVMINIQWEAKIVGINFINYGIVPKELRENFFDKYVTQGKEKGTGLGTYSAKLLIENTGGSIKMETSDDRTMTTISVKYPTIP